MLLFIEAEVSGAIRFMTAQAEDRESEPAKGELPHCLAKAGARGGDRWKRR
jgi:hypothetical protein